MRARSAGVGRGLAAELSMAGQVLGEAKWKNGKLKDICTYIYVLYIYMWR